MARKKARRNASEKPAGDEARKQALSSALEQIEKAYGKGAVMRMSEGAIGPVEVIPTGALSLDLALGVGGVPRGRVVEIFGPEASGKTTLALSIVAQAQKAGGNAVFIDAEHAFDPVYARRIGVDVDGLLLAQPMSGEEGLEIADTLVRSNAVDVVVVDSVAALVPQAELEGQMGDTFVGLQARLMSQALRKLSGVISKTRTCAVFINQVREKIGVMYGNPLTTPGGRALKFYSSVRLEIRRIGGIKKGDKEVGSVVRVKVAKNKVAPPFRKAQFDILFGSGVDNIGCVIDMALAEKVIKKSGAWLSYGDVKLGRGRLQARETLLEKPELFEEIQAIVKEKYSPEVGEAAVDDDASPAEL